MLHRWPARTIASLLFIAAWQCSSAEHREWVTLTNCQYIATKDCDGDSFRVRSSTKEFTLRLYFVDAPEPNLIYPDRTREQSEYFGITLDETVKAGENAKAFVRDILREPFVIRTRWAIAQGRSREPRYYGLVEVGTNRLDELLVGSGWARTKGTIVTPPGGPKSKETIERLRVLESQARSRRQGIWANSTAKKVETTDPVGR